MGQQPKCSTQAKTALGLRILVVNRLEHDEETPQIGLGLRCAGLGLGLDQNGTSLLVPTVQSTIRFLATDGVSPLSTSGARARARSGATAMPGDD